MGAKAMYKKSDCAATKRQTCTLEGNTEEEKSGFDVVFLNQISADQLGNRKVVRGGSVTPSALTPFSAGFWTDI